MSRRCVLVVEDDKDLGEAVVEILEMDLDYDFELIQDGRVALNRLSKQLSDKPVPDSVILDMHLPHVSGLEILEHIRSDPRLAGTKVIIMTADVILAEQVQDSADLVLVKPVSYDQLSELSSRIINA